MSHTSYASQSANVTYTAWTFNNILYYSANSYSCQELDFSSRVSTSGSIILCPIIQILS